MYIIPVSPAASLTIIAVAAVTAVLASATVPIMLCVLAAAATRKALEDLDGGQADVDAVQAHRMAVLRAIGRAERLRPCRDRRGWRPAGTHGSGQPTL
jgi:hypothetical protein